MLTLGNLGKGYVSSLYYSYNHSINVKLLQKQKVKEVIMLVCGNHFTMFTYIKISPCIP